MKDVAIVMGLHELSPVGRWAPGGCDRWRLERFAKMGQDLTSRGRSHPGLLPLANLRFEVSRLLPAVSWQPDVAAATGALAPIRAISFAQAIREVSCERGF